jgi:hypothetical protein
MSSKGASRLSRYVLSNVRVEHDALVEFEFLLLAFAAGIQDAVSFPDFHCFASKHTEKHCCPRYSCCGAQEI